MVVQADVTEELVWFSGQGRCGLNLLQLYRIGLGVAWQWLAQGSFPMTNRA